MRLIVVWCLIVVSLTSLAQNTQQKIVYHQQIASGLIKLDRSYFHYKTISQNESKSSDVHFLNTSKDTLELFFKNVPSYISTQVEPSVILPKQQGIIRVTYDASKNVDKNGSIRWGKDYKRLPIFVKGYENKRNARTDFITVRTFIDEDFSQLSKKELKNAPIIKFDTLVYNFGKVVQGTVVIHNFEFENLGKRDLEIRYAKGC